MSEPLKDIGALNRRLVLETPVESGDGAGGVVRTYEAATSLWAQVTPVSARSDVAADSFGAVARFRIVIRARGDITTRHCLREARGSTASSRCERLSAAASSRSTQKFPRNDHEESSAGRRTDKANGSPV